MITNNFSNSSNASNNQLIASANTILPPSLFSQVSPANMSVAPRAHATVPPSSANQGLRNLDAASASASRMALQVCPVGQQLPTLAEWNQRYVEFVLGYTHGKKAAAARILGINRRTLYRRKAERAIDEHISSIEVSTGRPGL
jgi:DNA-binding NtrC family response regulator